MATRSSGDSTGLISWANRKVAGTLRFPSVPTTLPVQRYSHSPTLYTLVTHAPSRAGPTQRAKTQSRKSRCGGSQRSGTKARSATALLRRFTCKSFPSAETFKKSGPSGKNSGTRRGHTLFPRWNTLNTLETRAGHTHSTHTPGGTHIRVTRYSRPSRGQLGLCDAPWERASDPINVGIGAPPCEGHPRFGRDICRSGEPSIRFKRSFESFSKTLRRPSQQGSPFMRPQPNRGSYPAGPRSSAPRRNPIRSWSAERLRRDNCWATSPVAMADA